MTNKEQLDQLAKDAVDAAHKALGYGVPVTGLGADSKATIARLASALIARARVDQEEK